MRQPQISVIMPVYNGEKYLREAINSILNQTYKDFELIIINDGSTDDSRSVINEFLDNRIIVIEQSNNGLARTLNIGAANCKGKYIARMDQDDISDPNRFLIQFNYLESHPKISVLSCAVRYINETGVLLGRSFTITWPNLIKKKLLHYGCVICHPGVMMRKADFDVVNGYSETIGGRFTDYHLWVKFVNNGFKIKNLSSVLLKYRIIESSMSSEFSLSHSASKILLKIVKIENPNPEEVLSLNNVCKVDNQSFKKRKSVYVNSQNKIYLKLVFLGEKTKSQIFSGIKNIVSLIN